MWHKFNPLRGYLPSPYNNGCPYMPAAKWYSYIKWYSIDWRWWYRCWIENRRIVSARVCICLNDRRAQCLDITSTQWSLTYLVSYMYIYRPLNSAMWDTLWLSPFHEFTLHCMTMAARGTLCIITCRPQMCTDTSNDPGHIKIGHMATELKIRELRVCQLEPYY